MQVGVQPRAVGAQVVRRKLEWIFLVVEITKIEVAVDRVDSVLREVPVLDRRTPEPFQAQRGLAGRDRFRGDGEQRSRRGPQHRGDVKLDDDAQDVGVSRLVGALRPEGEPPGRRRFRIPLSVCEVGVHPQPGEDAHAVGLAPLLVVHAKGDRRTIGKRARALLHSLPGAVRRRERAGDRVLIHADGEARAGAVRRDGHGSDAEPIVGGVREQRPRPSEGKDVHDEDQLTRPGRAGESVEVRDVGGGIGHGARA